MAKKPEVAKKTAAVTSTVRAAKPKTPRVKAAQHSKVVSPEPVVSRQPENPREQIAQLAYGYWEARGYQGGSALEDWCRAEIEYGQRLATAL